MGLIYFFFFCDIKLLGISLLDFVSLLFIPYLLFKRKKLVDSLFIITIVFYLYLLIVSIFSILIKDLPFAELFSAIKFGIILFLFLLLRPYLCEHREKVDIVVRRSLIIVLFASAFNLLLFLLNIKQIYNLSFLTIPEPFTEDGRFCGICSEPAHLGILLSVLEFYLVTRKKISFPLFLISVSISVLSMSMFAILMSLAIVCYYLINKKHGFIYILLFFVAVIVVGAAYVIKNDVGERLTSVFSMRDASTINRLIDSWRIAFDAPLYGFGMIESKAIVESIALKYNLLTFGNYYINNILAVAYFIGGPVSLFLLIVILFKNSNKKVFFFFFSLVLCISNGSLNESLTWIMFALIAASLQPNPLKKNEASLKKQMQYQAIA